LVLVIFQQQVAAGGCVSVFDPIEECHTSFLTETASDPTHSKDKTEVKSAASLSSLRSCVERNLTMLSNGITLPALPAPPWGKNQMPDSSSENEDALSIEDLRYWLKVETTSARLAARQRIAEAKTLVSEFASGKLGPHEITDRLDEYRAKWGFGARTPDANLQRQVDEAIAGIHAKRLLRKQSNTRLR
jgi:hypothetical protein